jgi:hypothetical protein
MSAFVATMQSLAPLCRRAEQNQCQYYGVPADLMIRKNSIFDTEGNGDAG